MRTLLAGLLALAIGGAHAQTIGSTRNNDKPKPVAYPIQFGLKAGVNLANLNSDIYSTSTNRTSFHVGGLAHIHLNDQFAIQPELVYSDQGFKQKLSSSLDLDASLQYLNVPVLFQYMFRGARIQTGPQVGFLLNTELDYTDNSNQDVDEYFKKTDFGWTFGVGYLTTSGFGIDARYNLGISNINKKITAPGITNTEINNRVWQFGVFYQFLH